MDRIYTVRLSTEQAGKIIEALILAGQVKLARQLMDQLSKQLRGGK